MSMFGHWDVVSEDILRKKKRREVSLEIGRPFVIEFRHPGRILYQPEEFVTVQKVCLKCEHSL